MEEREKVEQIQRELKTQGRKGRFGNVWKNWFEQNREITLFLLWALALLIVKLVMMRKIHICAYATAVADDALMVRMAENWCELHWLGGYNNYTLVKGVFFPAFLAVGHFLRIDYISWVQIFYAVSCVLFLIAFRPVLKWKWVMYVLYVILLFHPIMAALEVISRVYRNSITPAQVLLLLGGYVGLYFHCDEEEYCRGKRRLVYWSIMATAGFVSLYLSREDAVWSVPFLLVASGCIVYKLCKAHKFKQAWKKNVLILLLPFLVLAGCRGTITVINGLVYDSWTDNELGSGAFPRVMKAIYAVDMEEPADYTSVSREKVEAIYEVSPTLESIREVLDHVMDNYVQISGRVEENKEQGNVENGWFFWALRDAAAISGYHETAPKAAAFYNAVADEIEAAFEDGKLSKQWTMPSALMPPWKKGMLPELILTIGKAADYVVSGKQIALWDVEAVDDGNGGVERFEWISGRKAVTAQMSEEEHYTADVWNRIAEFWRNYVGLKLAWAGRICYMALVVLFFAKRLDKERAAALLMLTGIAGALLCLYAGIAYIELRSFSAIVYMYLSGAYPAAAAFDCIAIVTVAGYAAEYVKKYSGKHLMKKRG